VEAAKREIQAIITIEMREKRITVKWESSSSKQEEGEKMSSKIAVGFRIQLYPLVMASLTDASAVNLAVSFAASRMRRRPLPASLPLM
jgi:hypothetical protein